jgi:hypothetical protein
METTKPSAVIDKSLFQEICERPRAEISAYLKVIFQKYQPVVPMVLLEEILVNVASQPNPSPTVERMAERMVALSPYWLDDAYEIAFRELILEEKMSHLPQPCQEFIDRLLTLKKRNPELNKWVIQRRSEKEDTVKERMAGQNKMISQGYFKEVDNEVGLCKSMAATIRHILDDTQKKTELLETVFGDCFRSRHPEAIAEIDRAFRDYSGDTFAKFPLTLNCIVARLFYVFCPLVKIRVPEGNGLKKILGRKKQDQLNNLEDEQYVIAAMMCDRLLTRDLGMNNVTRVLQAGGLTQFQTVFFDGGLPKPNEFSLRLT